MVKKISKAKLTLFLLLSLLPAACRSGGAQAPPPITPVWNEEQFAVINSFLAQETAIDQNDQDLWLRYTTPLITVIDHEVSSADIFKSRIERAGQSPELFDQAYNPENILAVHVADDEAFLYLKEIASDATQQLFFVKDRGVWKWSGLK